MNVLKHQNPKKSTGLAACLILSASLLLQGCTIDASIWSLVTSPTTISGKIEGLQSQSSSQSANFCKVKLYQLDNLGQKNTFVSEALVDAQTGEFSFSSAPKDIQETAIQTQYSLEYICGNNFYQRFVTGFDKQNLNSGTTLLSWVSYSTAKSTIPEMSSDSWEKIYQTIGTASDLMAAYQLLDSNSATKNSFSNNFAISPEQLKSASPQILSLSAPKNLHELGSAPFSAVVVHWNSAYPLTVNWKLDDNLISQSKDFNFSAKKNHQGVRKVKILAGANDGNGKVDITKFHMMQEQELTIADDYPAVAPVMTRTSPLYTNSLAVTLTIPTGTLTDGIYNQCETFSKLALVEESTLTPDIAPTLESKYSLLCNTAGTQTLNFSLDGTEGLRHLKLWARDSSGNISSTPTKTTVVYDKTLPAFQILSLSGGQAVAPDTDTDITWTTTEENPTTLQIEYTLDNGANWVSLGTGLTDTGSFTWRTPNTTTSLAKVRLTMTDLAGNVGSTESTTTFAINSLNPPPPVVALASAEITNQTTVTIDVTCSPAFTRVLFSESSSAPSASNPAWQTCAAQRNTTISTGDGLKTLYAWSKDLSGRVSDTSNTVTVTLDQTAPTVTLTSHNSGTYSSRGALNITWTSTDTHIGTTPVSLSYSVSGGTFTDITTGNAANSTFAWPASFVDSAAVRIRATACDVAGNCSHDDSNADITLDGVAPVVTFTQINAGNTITANSYITVNFNANDARTGVQKYCLVPTLQLFAPANPTSSDSCWTPITNSASISLSRTVYLGFDEGLFTVYTWVMDGAGNISELSSPSIAEKDNDVISFGVPKPPNLKNASASGANTNVFPPAQSDLLVPAPMLFISNGVLNLMRM